VYRFVLTPRWLALALVMALAAATMVGLGRWQLSRYHQRSDANARIDAAASRPPVPLASVPMPLAKDREWTRVSVTGRYDPGHEILARGRTVNDQVGFEVFTPLVLADGGAVLVDRGWVPPPRNGDAAAFPDVPPAPTGDVTVTGAVHRPEHGGTAAETRGGRLEVRRVTPARLALPYRLVDGYVIADDPAAGFTAIRPDHQNQWQNLGYVVQWWLLAALTLFGFGYLARREAKTREEAERGVEELSWL